MSACSNVHSPLIRKRVRGQKKVRIKKIKKMYIKNKISIKNKNKIPENGESFKDWGSPVQGRGLKKNPKNIVKLRKPQGLGFEGFTAGDYRLKETGQF